MHPIVNEGLTQLKGANAFFKEAYAFIVKARDLVNAGKLNDAQLVDLAFVLREIAELGNAIRKESELIQGVAERAACVLWVALNAAKPHAAESIHGEIATGVPKIGQGAKVPPRDSEEYNALLRHLGCSDELIVNRAVSIHWPNLCEYLLARAERGQPLPPGLNPQATYPIYKVVLRQRPKASLEPRD